MTVKDGYEFHQSLQGGRLEVAAEHDPFGPFGELSEQISPSDPNSTETSDDIQRVLNTLAVLQEHTHETIRVPKQFSPAELQEWEDVARIVAGESVTNSRLGELQTELQEAPASRIDGDNAMSFATELMVRVGQQQLNFGQQLFSITAAHVVSDPQRPQVLVITPHPGVTWVRNRIAPVAPASQ